MCTGDLCFAVAVLGKYVGRDAVFQCTWSQQGSKCDTVERTRRRSPCKSSHLHDRSVTQGVARACVGCLQLLGRMNNICHFVVYVSF